MRKKYLSALLFGALLVTSAGTFTSCKDYDDDINNLQEQITANADAIKKLQEMIGDGKFVTGVTAENNGLKITWNDGQSTVIENVINGEAQQGDVVTINAETGEIVINGEGTGFFATKGEGEIKLPYVNDEGVLVLVDAEGKEVVTGIRVAPVTAVVNEDGSAEITIIGADGKSQTVKVPSAASSISEIEFLDNTYQSVKTDPEITLLYWDAKATTDWKGVRGNIPNNSTTYSTDLKNSTLYTRISPASVDASSINFKLVDTKDNEASINLKATKYDGILTRASNGLYEVKVVPGTFADGGNASKLANEFKTGTDNTSSRAMALKPGSANYKSLFNVKVTPSLQSTIDLGTISLNKGASNILNSVPVNNAVTDATPSSCSVKVGETVTASVTKYFNLYDLYLAVSEEDKELFGIEFSEDGRSFKATKSPDNVTDATIDLMVYTLPNAGDNGNIKCATIRIAINRTLGEATYEKQTQMPTKLDYSFLVSADKLKASLGDDLNAWYASVLTGQNVLTGIYDDEACTTTSNIAPNQLTVTMNENTYKPVTSANIATKLNYLKFQLNINQTTSPLKIGKTYYALLSFEDKNSNKELNYVVVPFELTKPELSSILVKESGVFRDGNDLAYAYMYWGDASVKISNTDIYESRYYIDRAFTDLYQKLSDCKMTTTPKFLIDDEAGNVKDTDKKTSYFATAYVNAVSSNNPAYINLIQDTDEDGKRDVAGYKKDLNIKFTGSYLDVTGDSSWSYSKTYQFRVMSPILEGEAIAANNLVEVSATGRTKLYKEDIWAKTYNNDVKYDIFAKGGSNSNPEWYRDDIENVTFSTGNRNVFEVTVGTPTAPREEGDSVVDSYIEVEGVSENTAKLNVAITDIWGYTLEDQVDIKTTLNLGE